jgi:peptide/nickel transport system substrate-binding protein
MFSKKLAILAIVMMIAPMVLVGCGPTPEPEVIVETVVVEQTKIVEVAGTPEVVVETVEVEVTAPPPEPEPAGPKTLVACMGQEPDTLYLYGGAMLAASHIQNAIYDGPVDNASFGYQPVIFDELPYLDTGATVINTVKVTVGDKVVDNLGEVIELTEAFTGTIRLAGCYAADCAVPFTGGEVEMEQMVTTFAIKDGVTWADGTPVTAADSVFAFELYMDPDTPNPTRYAGEHTASYEAVDEKTAVWTGLPGYRDSTYFLNFFGPLPVHQLGGMTAAEIVTAEESSRMPMGYGAFTVQEWVAGDHITVVKNPNYFRADEGLPKVDEIVYRFIGEDPNTAIAALLAGDCDILTQDLSLDSVAELMIELEAQGQMVPYFVTGTAYEHVDFCVNPEPGYAASRPDFFEDVNFRRAFGQCLNVQQVIDELMYGKSEQIASYIPQTHPVYNTDLAVLAYDPETAKASLEALGWVDGDGDGIREAAGVEGIPDGTKLAFKWGSTTADLRVAYMQVFQQNLLDCGMEITLENLPASEWFADGPEGPLFGMHYDVGSFTWLTGVEPACNLYLGTEVPTAEGGWAGQNNTGWANAEFDAACNAAVQSLPGTPEYEQYHKEAQRIFAEELPVIGLYLRLKIAATRPEITGFVMDPTSNSEFFMVEEFGFAEE